ncbi:DUF2889 domain-containing protein [Rhizobium sp. CF142]|uniref:DUF2889 domain-containing protein n=1 Tax=Rhizobium sp. CF142 TaxID=1144314 RepID=UPI00026EFEDD|nr:DUF2889 domain-containing protein [Rhizobium sp. CF142]EJJ29265.1 Protein of unknown function (DUF2889) [Rhizobium sp. CF142]
MRVLRTGLECVDKVMTEQITRQELHDRSIQMRGLMRSDGLFEVEGRVTDRKSYAFQALLGDRSIPAGEALHDMGVRLVFDSDLRVHALETFTDAAPYSICGAGGDALQSLVGLRMTSGWSARIRERLTTHGSCVHLVQLLGPMATVAFQTLSARRQHGEVDRDANGRPLKINSCFAYSAAESLVREKWPEHYEGRSAEKAPQASGE